jgi:hypothetical protein
MAFAEPLFDSNAQGCPRPWSCRVGNLLVTEMTTWVGYGIPWSEADPCQGFEP